MILLRRVRGVLSTALAWSIPWAVLGGSMLLAYFEARRGGIAFPSVEQAVRVNWILFRVGAEMSAVVGALAGGLFAAVLTLHGRHLQFEQLSAKRLAGYGAVGGLAIGAVAIPLTAALLGRPLSQLLPLIGISSILGAGSAWTMLAWARRSPARAVSALTNDPPESALLAAAHSEVEQLLSARDNLTAVGDRWPVRVAGWRPRHNAIRQRASDSGRIVHHIAAAGNTVVPALLALEALGFHVEMSRADDAMCRATRGDEGYLAEDPVTVLGLVRLVELRTWEWRAADADIDSTLRRHRMGE